MKITATLHGAINSQAQGSVTLEGVANMSGDANNAKFDVTLTTKMKDFTAVVVMKGSGNPEQSPQNMEITLNGEKMSQQDFEKMFSDVGTLQNEAGQQINSRR